MQRLTIHLERSHHNDEECEQFSIYSRILCCNFVNTVSSCKTDKSYDYFASYTNFINWCVKLKVSNTDFLKTLVRLADNHREEALTAFARINTHKIN